MDRWIVGCWALDVFPAALQRLNAPALLPLSIRPQAFAGAIVFDANSQICFHKPMGTGVLTQITHAQDGGRCEG